jgi:hypothetical protein
MGVGVGVPVKTRRVVEDLDMRVHEWPKTDPLNYRSGAHGEVSHRQPIAVNSIQIDAACSSRRGASDEPTLDLTCALSHIHTGWRVGVSMDNSNNPVDTTTHHANRGIVHGSYRRRASRE